MPRLLHGEVVRVNTAEFAAAVLAVNNPEAAAAVAAALRDDLRNFDFLFPDLQDDPANLLPEASPDTRDALVALGRTMSDAFDVPPPLPAGNDPGDTGIPGDPNKPGIPAAYTYFGQFIDHDITLEGSSSGTGLGAGDLTALFAPEVAPLSVQTIREVLLNLRTATLDLDSVYGPPAPRHATNGDKMRLGKVTTISSTAPGCTPSPAQGQFCRPELAPGQPKDDENDLPREAKSTVLERDRAAII